MGCFYLFGRLGGLFFQGRVARGGGRCGPGYDSVVDHVLVLLDAVCRNDDGAVLLLLTLGGCPSKVITTDLEGGMLENAGKCRKNTSASHTST